MTLNRDKSVLTEAEELDRLADALERESANWGEYDISKRPRYPSRAYKLQDEEQRRQADVLWDSAIAVGSIFVRLSEAGKLTHAPRVKNAVDHARSEMARSRRGGKPPTSYFVVNIYYDPHREDSYDVFFVKLFEALCKIFATSQEDRRAFETYYTDKKSKAAFHVRMVRAFSSSLKQKREGPND